MAAVGEVVEASEGLSLVDAEGEERALPSYEQDELLRAFRD